MVYGPGVDGKNGTIEVGMKLLHDLDISTRQVIVFLALKKKNARASIKNK